MMPFKGGSPPHISRMKTGCSTEQSDPPQVPDARHRRASAARHLLTLPLPEGPSPPSDRNCGDQRLPTPACCPSRSFLLLPQLPEHGAAGPAGLPAALRPSIGDVTLRDRSRGHLTHATAAVVSTQLLLLLRKGLGMPTPAWSCPSGPWGHQPDTHHGLAG